MARQLEKVLREHTPRLMALAGVIGTAQGEHDGKPCIVVMVAEPINVVSELFRNRSSNGLHFIDQGVGRDLSLTVGAWL